MRTWLSGVGAALLASLVWFPLTSTTQDPKLATLEKAPKEIGGMRLEAKIDFPDKSPHGRLVIEAKNPGGAAIKMTVKLLLQNTTTNPVARMMPRPITVWEKEIEISLEAGKDGRFSFVDPKFDNFAQFKGDEKTNFGATTLREIVVVCGKERATLLSNGPKKILFDIEK